MPSKKRNTPWLSGLTGGFWQSLENMVSNSSCATVELLDACMNGSTSTWRTEEPEYRSNITRGGCMNWSKACRKGGLITNFLSCIHKRYSPTIVKKMWKEPYMHMTLLSGAARNIISTARQLQTAACTPRDPSMDHNMACGDKWKEDNLHSVLSVKTTTKS